MAIHSSIPSMLQESLVEMFLVARDCINFRKSPEIWGSNGCYGYPSAILLFCIADGIGSYVIGVNTRRHFDVLNNRDYYNLNLDSKTISALYKKYRCLLTHNAVLATDVVLDIGSQNAPVYEFKNGKHLLNLASFLEITRISLEKFLKDSNNIVNSSKQLQEIFKS